MELAAPDREPVVEIPVRNVWHMFLYAWDLLKTVPPGLEAAVERAPHVSLLFATLLAACLERRMRQGLPRAYLAVEGEVTAIRGRLDVLRSSRTQAFERGRAWCRFETYDVDSPRNRIIKGTLVRLLGDRTLWNKEAASVELRRRLERCAMSMTGVAAEPATRAAIRKETPGRNDVEDRLVLALCELLLEAAMPTETSGPAHLLQANRDVRLLRFVFERFVARFLDSRLSPLGWQVRAQRHLAWPVEGASSGMSGYLPRMQADIILLPPASKRWIVVDTKFTSVLARGKTGAEVFKSAHLYQIYTYVQTQADASQPLTEAILLYPAVGRCLSEYMRLPGQVMRLETVDLAMSWLEIEQALLHIIQKTVA
jgi:5-methylcytosine-specific restriction enzyme subunit McrC